MNFFLGALADFEDQAKLCCSDRHDGKPALAQKENVLEFLCASDLIQTDWPLHLIYRF